MAVYKTLSLYEFEQEFRDFGRDYYSRDAYSYLYELLSDGSAELDVIAVCCDWAESDAGELWDEYGYMVGGGEFTSQGFKSLLETLEAHTMVVQLPDSFLVASF